MQGGCDSWGRNRQGAPPDMLSIFACVQAFGTHVHAAQLFDSASRVPSQRMPLQWAAHLEEAAGA